MNLSAATRAFRAHEARMPRRAARPEA